VSIDLCWSDPCLQHEFDRNGRERSLTFFFRQWNFCSMWYVSNCSRMRKSLRKATLVVGVLALFLQATIGFACGIQCALDCAQAAKVSSSNSNSHCGDHDGTSKHKCNGSCQTINASDSATVPPTPATLTSHQVLDAPAIIPEKQDSIELTQVVAAIIYSSDSGPPGSHLSQTLGSRAPPVA
jgi:hypothetical protein